MTPAEQEQFLVRLAVLAEVYAEPMTPTRLEAYTQLLADQALEDLLPALEACAKVCTFFPKPIDILDGITTVRVDRAQTQTKRLIARSPEYGDRHCTICQDTGFVRDLRCPGDGRCHVAHCGQPGHTDYAHDYTRRCDCRATNPVLVQARETLRAMAPKAAAREKHERDHTR